MTDVPQPSSPYLISNPEEFARNLLRLFEEGGKALNGLMERPDVKVTPYSAASEMTQATATLSEIMGLWMSQPERMASAQTDLVASYAGLWNNFVLKMMGEQVPPVIEPEPSDNRFKDAEWSTNPYYDFWKQAYLLTTQWAEQMLARTDGLEGDARKRAEFYFRQVSSALSPSNFPMLNPEVVRTTLSSNASNLVDGMTLLVEDMQKSGDLLKVSQTDTRAFEVGRNLATTPGKIVFQNELLQLIQYAPTTEKVRELPLLIVPPWINKYYVLDLTPAKSLIKYAVDQGFTVFVVSWVNPDESLANKTFEDYMLEGLLEAVDAVREETALKQINMVGYCVGGTLLGSTLAYLAARGETPFNSVTFLATQVDFSDAGDLLLFTGSEQLSDLEAMMNERGYLDGSRMSNVFNMMRSRDLIWPYIVSNYMLGKKPFPFDLLYWNQDSTRMCAANHAFYLREFYNENRLAKGEMTLGGVKLDLSKIKLPIYHLATKEDHIAPARSVYLGAKLLKNSDITFVLAGSGHIAGVVNPPDKAKYQYWTSRAPLGGSLDDWLETAKPSAGSWWPNWIEWLSTRSGQWTLPRDPGERLGTIENAPGSYVKAKA